MHAQVVMAIEVVRCWHCKQFIHPQQPCVWRWEITAIQVGRRDSSTRREQVAVHPWCHEELEARDAAERNRVWWFRFWCVAVVGHLALGSLGVPYSVFALYGAILWRTVWKWRAKRRQQRAPGQTAQRVLRATAPSAAAALTKSDPSS